MLFCIVTGTCMPPENMDSRDVLEALITYSEKEKTFFKINNELLQIIEKTTLLDAV